MTVSTTASSSTFLGNGATTTFEFSWIAVAAADIEVIYFDTEGAQTTLSPSQYTLVISAADPGELWGVGGSVTYPTSGSPIASGSLLVVQRILPLTQDTTISNQGDFYPQSVEAMGDVLCMEIQQVSARTSQLRGTWASDVSYNVGDYVQDGANGADTLNYYMCAIANVSTVWATDLAAGDWILAIDVATISADTAVAVASAAAALISETNAANSQAAAALSASSASASQTSATASAASASTDATNADADAASAAASAALAAAIVGSVPFSTTVFLTFADSPYTVLQADDGTLFSVDTSGGAFAVTLPLIAGLVFPFNCAFKKSTEDGNTITFTPSGSDLIDGRGSHVIATTAHSDVFIPSTTTTPDEWTTVGTGAYGGNITVDTFSGNGATTAFTLSIDPGTENNTSVFVSGVYISKLAYSVSGVTLTFAVAPASGTNNIQVNSGTTLAIGIPADNAVSTVKIQDLAVTAPKLATGLGLMPTGSWTYYDGFVLPTGFLWRNNQAVSRVTYATLLAAITASTTGTVANGSPTITSVAADYTNYGLVGAKIEGTGIPANTTIIAITATTITLSANGTASNAGVSLRVFPWGNGDGSTTFNLGSTTGRSVVTRETMGNISATNTGQVTATLTTTSGNANATVSSATGLFQGMYVRSAANVSIGTTILSISGLTITLSALAIGTGAATTRFSPFVDVQSMGSVGGELGHVLVTASIPAHSHPLNYQNVASSGSAIGASGNGNLGVTTGLTGGGQAHNNVQPSQITNAIIKY